MKLIVFDMDGVIVDVSRSYREAVRQTSTLFLKGSNAAGALPDPLFSLADLARIKQAGGLNNDWELTYHVLGLLLQKVKIPDFNSTGKVWELHEQLIQRWDLSGLVRFLKMTPSPLETLHELHPNTEHTLIEKCASGDVGSGNIIKQIFQEVYLGGRLFEKTYGFKPRMHLGRGLIDREALLLPLSFFSELSQGHVLAIATGRPKAEADHALDHFGLRTCFKMICTLDDCLDQEKTILGNTGKKVSLSKPDPYMLDEIGDAFSGQASERYYIGDMPDDMMAAVTSRYDYYGIGTLYSAPNMNSLRGKLVKAGAHGIAENVAELKTLISRSDSRSLAH